MNVVQPLSNNNFRVTPLNIDDDVAIAFQLATTSAQANFVNKTIDLTVMQTEELGPVNTIYKLIREKLSFQIDMYTNRGGAVMSFIALDCIAIYHNFELNYSTSDVAQHMLSLAYREMVWLDSQGALIDNGANDSDLMMSKIIMIPQKG